MPDFQFFRDFIFPNGLATLLLLFTFAYFYKHFNFTNQPYPRNSWNLNTSKKPTILIENNRIRTIYILSDTFCDIFKCHWNGPHCWNASCCTPSWFKISSMIVAITKLSSSGITSFSNLPSQIQFRTLIAS